MNRQYESLLPSFSPVEAAEAAAREIRQTHVRVAQSTEAAALKLLEWQTPEGYWCGNLTADTTLESDYLLLRLWLYPPVDGVWQDAQHPRVRKAVRSILNRQLPDGGWCIYQGGPSEVNATVRAYTALKLAGMGRGDGRWMKLGRRRQFAQRARALCTLPDRRALLAGHSRRRALE